MNFLYLCEGKEDCMKMDNHDAECEQKMHIESPGCIGNACTTGS